MTERIRNNTGIIGKNLEIIVIIIIIIIGTFSGQSDHYTWIVTNHNNNYVVYT